ncbi:major histocompatibility complex class I-related gene protein-like, partial [Protobothrops mucrosquamatus]|uniref:major histocompatibility complex class I-related gene protein-like n=1 Tax=Protobothrops mucrosquamatus TaxID=103944 RepID=UPI0010FB99D8
MIGCELQADGKKGGFDHHGYDGRTFLTFDKETLTWVAPQPQAQITQRKWDAIPGLNQREKAYLEEICIEWLEKYLSYGNETLLRTDYYPIKTSPAPSCLGSLIPAESLGRTQNPGVFVVEHFPDLEHFLKLLETLQALEGLRVNSGGAVSAEPPEVTVSSKTEVEDGMETRVCRLDGFYPRENDASWMRDGEVWLQDTFRGSVAPNADGTFHSWLSIRIDPQEKGRYRCHVEHDGLQEPLDVAIKDPPMVTVNRTVVENGMEMHVCYMDGFYPKKIDASWRRDGEVWQNDTLHGPVAPNADGTFHTWLSIWINPKERGCYRCHVEHDGLQEPLDVAIKEPKSNVGIIIGCVVAGLVLLGMIVGIWFFKKRRDGYKAPS